MIQLYSGTPGSGKSLHLAKDIFHLLNQKNDCLVICNFEINLDLVKHPNRFFYISNSMLSPEYIIRLCNDFFNGGFIKEGSVVLIIDECQILFNTRDWASTERRPWLDFFSQHRKYGIDVYLVAQYDQMIDKQIRALIEYEVIHRKVTRIGAFGGILKVLTFGDWFVSIDVFYGMKMQIGFTWYRARKKYFRLYNTFNTFNVSDSVVEFSRAKQEIISTTQSESFPY